VGRLGTAARYSNPYAPGLSWAGISTHAGLHHLAVSRTAPVVCIQKARGSSPLSSTGQRPNAILKASKQSQTKSQSRRTIRHMTATARRGHGEGSVYRDAVNGTWVGAISLGWRPDGSRIRSKATGRTKTEVREKLKKL
jgi:hypothetical protein